MSEARLAACGSRIAERDADAIAGTPIPATKSYGEKNSWRLLSILFYSLAAV